MHGKALKLVLIGTILTFQGACMHLGSHQHGDDHGLSGGLSAGQIVETNTGETISFDVLMADLSRANVIYVGETHTSKEDHRVQLQILKGLYARNHSLVLALEMFPREAQPLLDQYANGSLTEDEFLKEVRWDEIWGYPFELYRPIISWAKDHHMRIVGLNAPREIVAKIARSGLSSLTEGERERVAEDFHLNDPAHQEYIRQQYRQHLKGAIQDFNTFLEAQLAWEETMAETLAQTLAAQSPDEQILVLIGKGHISDRVGVPKLAGERIAQVSRSVASVPLDYPGRTADPGIADFVWITNRSEPMHRVRLGVMFRLLPSGAGLEIVRILPNSPAANAGLHEGDILYMLDGIRITSLDEVHKALAARQVHQLMVKRGNKQIAVTVNLPP
jgi:uncharacterized iron-regulated protein